jgi:hypothetical protein
MNRLIEHIAVEITSVSDANVCINEFIDIEEEAVNSVFVLGNMFVISGNKIKIAGDDPCCGLYFGPVDEPSKAVKVERIGENAPSKITGIVPHVISPQNKIEIRTQYTGGAALLKTTRIISSAFVVEGPDK